MFGPANVPGGSLNTKQEKLTGVKGQLVGFDENGNAVPQKAPDTGVITFKGRTGAVTPQAGDYTAEQVGAVPKSRKVNGKALDKDINITAADVGAVSAGGTAATAEKLSTARALLVNLSSSIAASFDGSANVNLGVTGTLPIKSGGTGATSASAAISNLGAVPTTRKVNGQALSSDITLGASDVNARPSTWMPTAAETGAAPAYKYGTSDLTAGSSTLATGTLYFVYE